MDAHAADRPSRSNLMLYATLLVGSALVAHLLLRETYAPGHPVRMLLTGLLIGSFALFVGAQVRLALSLDEFQRQVHLASLAIAYPIALVLVFGVGYLRAEGWFAGADPRDLWMLLLLPYAVGLAATWRRYQ
jgi:hypothetical protein